MFKQSETLAVRMIHRFKEYVANEAGFRISKSSVARIVISIKTFHRNNVVMQALFSGMNSSYIRTKMLRIVILYNYF